MATLANTDTIRSTARFFPISIATLDSQVLGMDLYLKTGDQLEPVLYRATGVEFTVEDQERLASQGIQFLYVPMQQHRMYRQALAKRLDRQFLDPEKNRIERANAVRASCLKIIEEVLANPGQPEMIETANDLSRQFAEWMSKDGQQFSYLFDMSAHDYYTTTHMINVSVAVGLLARELRPGDPEYQAMIIQGGMLHDVGKRDVSEEILNKEGKLEPEEWAQLRKHPLSGYRLLGAQPNLPPCVLEMCRDHHERLDGKGYPAGVTLDRISLAARICTVTDVYDAISASRPYRGPTPPLRTLDMMREGVETQFDRDLFAVWERLVQGMIEQDPERAVPESQHGAKLSLTDLTPAVEAVSTDEIPELVRNFDAKEQRRYQRYSCNRQIQVKFLQCWKPIPVRTQGSWFKLALVDISMGGAQIRTPFPLSRNDTLLLKIALNNGWNKEVKARVVRIRKFSTDTHDEAWLAGLEFIGWMDSAASNQSQADC